MKHLALVVALVVALVGCKAKDKPKDDDKPKAETKDAAKPEQTLDAKPAPDPVKTGSATADSPEIVKLMADANALADKMCACPDVACLDKTEEEIKKLGENIDEEELAAVADQLDALEERVTTCALKTAEATPLTGEHAAEGEKILAKFRAMRDAVCKCADLPCVETAVKDGEAVQAELEKIYTADDDGHFPPAFEAVLKSASNCMDRLTSAP